MWPIFRRIVAIPPVCFSPPLIGVDRGLRRAYNLDEETTMPDEVKRIDYYYTSVPDKPGEGARILAALRDGGVNLIGISAFPYARRSQIDLIPEDGAAFVEAAKAAGLKLSKKKSGFLITGRRPAGCHGRGGEELADAKINVT
jgi:hypothetical protein